MAVRDCREIGENLIKVIRRLMANDDLIKLLYYTDKDPLSKDNLTEKEKQEKIFEKFIKIVPRIGPKETAQSVVSIYVSNGTSLSDNDEFKVVTISIEIFVPLTQWIIKDTNLRPFAIMSEIKKSLDDKTINGLGLMRGGDFILNFLTDEIGCYKMTFKLVSYD